MQIRKIALACVSPMLLAGCLSAGPLPALNNADVPAAFEQAAPSDAPIWPAPDWWHGFSSSELDGLIATTQAGNLSLAAAEARVLQADARVRQAGAALLPTVGFGADARREFVSDSDAFGLSLGASYELDFWGRNRNTLNAAIASGNATRADRETVALTATTSVANTYFQLLSFRERLSIARLNLENAQSVLMVTEARVRNGIASQLELAQQRAAIASQQASIPQFEQQELQTRAALAVLLGRPPEGFDVSAQDLEDFALPAVAPGLPSELLTRRPDVAVAEASLEASHANVAVARAAMFPSITLTGAGGLQSVVLGTLLSNPGTSFSLGASLAQTVFDAGRLAAITEEARARETEILANYRNVAITAFSEVETTLGSIGHLAEQEGFLMEQVVQAEQAFNIAQARYREGVADYLTVLDSQRTLYSARDQLSQIKFQRLVAIVALYKALGGGWQNPAATVAKISQTN
jgi:NodT family efflux transporter outer membrane factor (OMF) lipoprotein